MKQMSNEVFFEWVEDSLAHCGCVRFRVKGFSMYPLLRNNIDEVLLQNCRAEDLKIGDIVLFKNGTQHVLHRFIKRDGIKFIFQGDNVKECREVCRAEDIVGLVANIYRRKGNAFVQIAFDSPKWRLITFLWRLRRKYL